MKNNNITLSGILSLNKRKGLQKSGFTLVELIVVITILAILGTIAFISMSGYSATSRDSVRLSDASSMRTSLEIYQVNSGKYPLPDQNGYFEIDSETLWWQGKFNGTVIDNLSRNFSEAPQDPLSEKSYTYSVAGNKNEYQLLVLLEGDEVSNNSSLNSLPLSLREGGYNLVSQTNAATQTRIPKVSGTYNGLYIKTATKFYALPSIITALDFNEGANSLTGTMMSSLVVNGYDNVPNEGNIKYVTGALDIPEIVYSTGTVSSNDGNGSKASVVRMLQNAYSGSKLSNDGIHKYIINLEDDDKVLANVLDTVVLGNAADVAITSNTVVADTEAPTGGSFTIDEGTTTTSTTINLTITCPVEDGVEMTVYGTGVQSGISYTPCTGSGQVTLTSGDGTKEVAMKFKDSEDNESSEDTSSITLSSISDYLGGTSKTGLEFKIWWNSLPTNSIVWFQKNNVIWEVKKLLNETGDWGVSSSTLVQYIHSRDVRWSENSGSTWTSYTYSDCSVSCTAGPRFLRNDSNNNNGSMYAAVAGQAGWGCGSYKTFFSNGQLCASPNNSTGLGYDWTGTYKGISN